MKAGTVIQRVILEVQCTCSTHNGSLQVLYRSSWRDLMILFVKMEGPLVGPFGMMDNTLVYILKEVRKCSSAAVSALSVAFLFNLQVSA